jgi:hypothetical protein
MHIILAQLVIVNKYKSQGRNKRHAKKTELPRAHHSKPGNE